MTNTQRDAKGTNNLILSQANDSGSSKELLTILSKSNDEILRGAIALNPSTPKNVLEELLNDNSSYVQSCLGKRGFNKTEKLTICIAGKNDIAVNGLKLLKLKYDAHNICFISNPDDDGLDGWQPSLKKTGRELGIKEVKLEELYEIEDLLFLSLEFSEIIKTESFSTEKLFNIHFSLLPKYKGMYTSALPLLHGDDYSGVTLHKIDDGIDSGDIVAQIKFNIEADDTAQDLYAKYLKSSFLLFQENIDDLINGSYVAKPQSPIGASYFSKKSIDYKNFSINFFKTAFEVRNQFRAFTFRQYQMPKFEGWEISKVDITDTRSTLRAGTKKVENDEFIVVSTIDYDVKLYKDYYNFFWHACELGDISKFNDSMLYINDFNLKNNRGWNAIIIATYNGCVEIFNKLIELGADVNSKNNNGTTLLMYALSHYKRSKDSTLFQILLKLGSDTLSIDKHGKDLKHYIAENKCEALLKYLD